MGIRTALGVDDRFLLGGLVDDGSILAGSAFRVALAALTPSYGEWRDAVEAFANRNSHLDGHRFTNDDEIHSKYNALYLISLATVMNEWNTPESLQISLSNWRTQAFRSSTSPEPDRETSHNHRVKT